MKIKLSDQEIVYSMDILKEVENTLRKGLIYDGEHHKQYYLAKVAELLNMDMSDLDIEEGNPV